MNNQAFVHYRNFKVILAFINMNFKKGKFGPFLSLKRPDSVRFLIKPISRNFVFWDSFYGSSFLQTQKQSLFVNFLGMNAFITDFLIKNPFWLVYNLSFKFDFRFILINVNGRVIAGNLKL